MATAATFSPGATTANHRMFNMPQSATKISPELKEYLGDASTAFQAKCYKTAAKHYNIALNLWIQDNNKRQNQMFMLIRYMLCMCLLESNDAKDLLDALKNLEELMSSNQRHEYPMLYYALGKAYFKLYRFEKADEILKRGFAAINSDMKIAEYMRPETSVAIPESKKERLLAELVNLRNQCSGWHRPDASCCLADCSSHCHNEGVDKNIFFGSPTFNGMVQVTCNNPSNFCTMHFHLACWKTKKEQLCSLGKLSDKDVLNRECFTPNCENQGVRCVIKKIEIYDEKAQVKACVEPRADDFAWHAKVNQPVKGAVKKQQQTPKPKTPSNETRAVSYERPPSRPQTAQNDVAMHNSASHRVKMDEADEDDDLHDEQAMKAAMERLVELRERNFDIPVDEIWRPDLQMYGNEYMLSTAEQIPDPDFGYDDEAITKGFLFSYFHSYISESGPVRLEDLAIKWEDAKTLSDYSHCILNHHLDIADFLLQSLKFAIVGDYICVAGKLPDAYYSTRDDVRGVLKFFMENEVDQQSNSSSVDEDATFNEIINQEKNNNSISYCSASGDEKTVTEESSVASELERKEANVTISGPIESEKPEVFEKSVPSGQMRLSNVFEAEKTLANDSTNRNEIPSPNYGEMQSPIVKNVQKRARVLEYPEAGLPSDSNARKIDKKSENETFQTPTNGFPLYDGGKNPFSQTNCDNEKPEEIQTKLQFNFGDKTFPTEFRSTSDELNASASGNPTMNNYGETGNRAFQTKRKPFLSSPNGVNGTQNNGNNWDSPRIEKCKDDVLLVEELIKEVKELSGELAANKNKAGDLKSELEQVKKSHAAMRMRMLQKSLHGQYAYEHSLITSKIEECRKNSEVFAGIQSMLMNSIGEKLPDSTEEWQKVRTKLEEIAKNHEAKFWELDNQLCSSVSLGSEISEICLPVESMPSMPQRKLMDVIEAAFGLYRMYQMKEFQRVQVGPPPLASVPPPTTSVPPPNMRVSQPLFANQGLYPSASVGYGPPQPHYLPSDQNFSSVYGYLRGNGSANMSNPPPAMRPANAAPAAVPPILVYPGIPDMFRNYYPPTYAKAGNFTGQQIPQTNAAPNRSFPKNTIAEKYVIDPSPGKSVFSPSEKANFETQLTANQADKNFNQAPTPAPRASPVFAKNETLPPRKPNSVAEIENLRTVDISADKNSRKGHFAEQNDRPNTPAHKITGFGDINENPNHSEQQVSKFFPTTDNQQTFADPDAIADMYRQAIKNNLIYVNMIITKKNNKEKSLDKLVRKMREIYSGVLELDLIKAIEGVRKSHNNSLSGLNIARIIREADAIIIERQQKQLCGYNTRLPHQYYAVATPNSANSWCSLDSDRSSQMSPSTSSVFSMKKEPQRSFASKKTWEPVTEPNGTWTRETSESICCICLESVVDEEFGETCALKCKHVFHVVCIETWNVRNPTCPECRVYCPNETNYPALGV